MTETPSSSNVPGLSVLIPTKDEERNIEACLDAVSWAGETIVFDSFSTDRTVEIAKARGARVVQRVFDNFAAHKNWALDNIDFAHSWVLIVDADERIPPGLASEVAAAVAAPGDKVGFYVARKNHFKGRWLRYGGMYPDWQLRLVRLGQGRYENRAVHEHMRLNGPAGFLKTPLVHDDYKGIERYIDRHNTYSSLEAVEAFRQHATGQNSDSIEPSIFTKGPHRRRALKNLAYRFMPARPLFVFLWMYLVRLGFLQGRIGLEYAILRAIYEFQVDLKRQELKRPDSAMRQRYADLLAKRQEHARPDRGNENTNRPE